MTPSRGPVKWSDGNADRCALVLPSGPNRPAGQTPSGAIEPLGELVCATRSNIAECRPVDRLALRSGRPPY